MTWSRVVSFTDPEPCQAAIQGGQVEILPTTRGSFHVEITQIRMKRLWMQRFKVVLPQISTVLIEPDRKVVGFLTEPTSSNLQHCGMDVTRDDLLLPGFDMLHQRSESDLEYGSMSVPVKDFPDLCKAIIGREFLEDPCITMVRPDPALLSRLLKLHKAVGQLAHDTPDVLELPEVGRALEEQLIHLMVRCLAAGVAVETTTGERRHDAIMGRFEAFLEAHPNRPLYLTDICIGIGVAERTLRAACEEHLGMGPIRYLTLRRMHLVRRALLRTDSLNSTVTRTVTDHGFWELGRFSVAYRELFGESPSETLRRPGEQWESHRNRPSSLVSDRLAELRH